MQEISTQPCIDKTIREKKKKKPIIEIHKKYVTHNRRNEKIDIDNNKHLKLSQR